MMFCQQNDKLRTVAFYNLENLFDTIDDPLKNDEASPMMQLKGHKSGAYYQKLSNMGKVLSLIGKRHSKSSPSIIGLAEIENRNVLEDLLATDHLNHLNYQIIHYDSPDLRGIDVAFIYKPDQFSPISHEIIELGLWDEKGMRQYTRDQLVVSGYLDGDLIHIIINHWPSRRGGVSKSSYKREKAAYLNRQITEKITKNQEGAKIIIMGDFNDDPTNTSIKKVLNTKRDISSLQVNDLYNPMEKMFRRGAHTLVYRDQINLFDQIIISEALLPTETDLKGWKYVQSAIYNPPYLTHQKGRFKGYPHRSFSNEGFTGGYSDHYPVFIVLAKMD